MTTSETRPGSADTTPESAPESVPATPGTGGPLRAVLTAFEGDIHSLDDIARHTGLARDVVSAAVDHLVRAGRIEARELAVGCPDGGCGSCASGCARAVADRSGARGAEPAPRLTAGSRSRTGSGRRLGARLVGE